MRQWLGNGQLAIRDFPDATGLAARLPTDAISQGNARELFSRLMRHFDCNENVNKFKGEISSIRNKLPVAEIDEESMRNQWSNQFFEKKQEEISKQESDRKNNFVQFLKENSNIKQAFENILAIKNSQERQHCLAILEVLIQYSSRGSFIAKTGAISFEAFIRKTVGEANS
ncbi:MAG: hypothetical protein LBB16_01540 [Puniceicoccales bacterium]|jgi:hypothetical protein|nr:hypothetical protein [Puniceicoccales bacterium]